MEKRYRFLCPQCRYSARVSGGDGEHFDDPTTTFVCLDCERLFEMACTVIPWGPGPIEISNRPKACPVDADHPLQSWTHPGPCPRCGTELERFAIKTGKTA